MNRKAVLGLPVSMERLAEVAAFIENTLSVDEIDVSDSYAVSLAADEICTNIFTYSNAQRMSISIEITPADISVTITDDGAPFDPLSVPPPNLEVSIEEREPGGLGIHLVRTCMEDVSYEYREETNILRMVRHRQEPA